jgi:CheY-like chemotaxis protein
MGRAQGAAIGPVMTTSGVKYAYFIATDNTTGTWGNGFNLYALDANDGSVIWRFNKTYANDTTHNDVPGTVAVIDDVGDGELALEAFEKNPYSVVLVDLQMPEMDGVKLTLLLRSVESSARTPIIVLTAAGGPREWQRLSAIGADAFLVKPVNADDVELVIRRTLRSRHTSPPSGPAVPTAPNETAPV